VEPGAEHVYGSHALLRSAAVLQPRFGGTIDLPGDIAPLVQVAYGPEPLGPAEWQEAMRTAETRWVQTTVRREDAARSFQIADPGKAGKPISGWLAASVGEADESSQGRGQVRDGAPSLEAILVQTDEAGRWHTAAWLEAPDANLPVPRDDTPPDELAEVLAMCALRLPLEFSNAAAEQDLWAATPPAWEFSQLIYRLPVLVVDEDGWGVINGRRVRYTAERGLDVLKGE
jgi:CRISPR-associated endonuclease/helicase Cas3